jgi:AraC-like DNA-binding protein
VERLAARQQRKAVLDQVLADNNDPPPSLTQVAGQLNCTDAGLAEQFPQESQLIMQQYQAYKIAEKQAWKEALQAALADDQTPPPTLIEVARQLGHATSKKLQFHFPDICQQLLLKRQTYLVNHRQKLRAQLEVILSDNREQPPPPLTEVACRLGITDCTLRRLFPAQTQAILERCQRYKETKKMAAERTLQAILADEQKIPPAMETLTKELGYSRDTLRFHFPELIAAVMAKRQALIKAKNQPQF